MNLIGDTQLMKQSKADLVAALQSLGFTDVTTATPLSEIAELMKWAGGLRDVMLACVPKSGGNQVFFTREQWAAMSVTSKNAYISIGVRVRAERTQFIVAKTDATTETGSTSMSWCTAAGTDVPGLRNYKDDPAMFKDLDAKSNTDKILACVESAGITCPAATRARAYKAATAADGGYDDPTEWSLPTVGQMLIMYKYLVEINAELQHYFDSTNTYTNYTYWTSNEHDASRAWNVTMGYGSVNGTSKTNTLRVRAVASVVESAI